MPTLHSVLTGADLHETKGAATATSGQYLTANGDGTATFKTIATAQVGWYDYNDTATAGTPIALTAGVKSDLTNNTLGVNTNTSFGIPGVANIWNAGTNRFDFSQLMIGDTLETRVDLVYTTTSANTAITLEFEFASGTGSAFTIIILPQTNFKTAGTHQITHSRGFYIGSAVVRDNPCRIRAVADTAGSSVVVNGWYTRVIKGAV